MEQSVEFIRSLLSSAPQQNLIVESENENFSLELESDLDKLEFELIENKKSDYKAGAVDGGQGTIVRNAVYTAGVYRAGYVIFDGLKRSQEYSTELNLANLDYSNYLNIYRELYRTIFNIDPQDSLTFSNTLSSLRKMVEYQSTVKAITELKAGDMLLLDGSLQDEEQISRQIYETAKSAQINVVGVTKSSSLLWQGGANLVGMLNKLGDEKHRHKCWYVRVGKFPRNSDRKHLCDIYAAKLNGYCDRAFRVDLSTNNYESPAEVFSKLTELSLDPYFLGYPYPLASVHQMVRVTAEELDHFARRLKDITLTSGVQESEWAILFGDYHNILNHGLKDRMVRA